MKTQKSMHLIFWNKCTLIIALVLLLSACTGNITTTKSVYTEDGKEYMEGNTNKLTVAWDLRDIVLDPQVANNETSLEILNATYEGLVRLNKNGNIEKKSGLAKDWHISEDGLIYTFYLNEATWSDGSKITAEDFKQSWLRALLPETNAYYAFELYPIKNAKKFHHGEINDPNQVMIKAIDDNTLEVILEKPSSVFLALTSLPVYFPYNDPKVFSGPFIISNYIEGKEIILEKNSNYWDKNQISLEKIEGKFIENEDEKIRLFEAGNIDSLELVESYINKYKDSKLFQEVSEGSVWWIQFNIDNNIFKNKNIRKAFAYSIDRQRLVTDTLGEGRKPAYGIVPNRFPTISGAYYKYDGKEFFKDNAEDDLNIEKLFNDGLKEVQRKKTNIGPIGLLVRDTEKSKSTAYELKDMWENILGVKIKVEPVPLKIQLDKMINGDYDLAYTGWTVSHNDPQEYLYLWKSDSEYNYGMWKNKDYDKLINQLEVADSDKRLEILLEAEKILMDEMPISPIYFKTRAYLTSEKVADIVRFPTGVFNEYKYINLK